jgi:hypothetical protein
MPVQSTSTVVPARCAPGLSSAPSQARLLSAVATLRDALAPDVALNVPDVLDETALLACLSVIVINTPTNLVAPASCPNPADPACSCPACDHMDANHVDVNYVAPAAKPTRLYAINGFTGIKR